MGICDSKTSNKFSVYRNNIIYSKTGIEKQSSDDITKRESLHKQNLIQKSKQFHSSLEEMKLCVNTRALIDKCTDSPQNKYRIINKIGEGSFGVVYYVQNIQNEAFVAMKKISKVKNNVIEEMSISNEIEILKELDHPNIIRLFEFYNTPDSYYIINEYCSKGELYSKIKSKLIENQLAVIFYQIFLGLNYLHHNNVIHRDLKLANILISDSELDPETGRELFWIKLIDFGCAKILSKQKNEKTIVGTSYYMAPEVILQNYNYKCDIWSAGVLLYMLVTEKAPFNGYNDEVIKTRIKEGKYNKDNVALKASSPELRNLISKLLEMNVNERISAKEALDHPWFELFKGRILFDKIDRAIYNKQINNIVHYFLQSKLQQMVLAYLCHNITLNEEIRNAKKLFIHMNSNYNGRLTKDELLKGIIPYLGQTEANRRIEDLFLTLDGDNSGFIEYEEFLRACLDKETILKEELLQYAFNFFDKNGADEITRNQLYEMFKSCNHHKKHITAICSNIINEHDKKKKGTIDYNDFKQMISNTYSQIV